MNMNDKALALKYVEGDKAPKIIAKGKRKIAEKIIETAKKYGIPVKYDKVLVEALFDFDINDYIPEEFYGIVAEILAFVFRVKGK